MTYEPNLTPISARRGARIAVVQGLYMQEQTQCNTKDIAQQFTDDHFVHTIEAKNSAIPDKEYFKKLLTNIPLSLEKLDVHIQDNLQELWKIDRLSAVVRCILRSAVYELLYEPTVPAPVVLNEYIEVGRAFVDEKDIKFINGLLDKVAKNVRPECIQN